MTTVLQLLDNKTGHTSVSFLKESTFVEEGDISPIKLNITIAFVSVVHILMVEYMLTQKNHYTLNSH